MMLETRLKQHITALIFGATSPGNGTVGKLCSSNNQYEGSPEVKGSDSGRLDGLGYCTIANAGNWNGPGNPSARSLSGSIVLVRFFQIVVPMIYFFGLPGNVLKSDPVPGRKLANRDHPVDRAGERRTRSATSAILRSMGIPLVRRDKSMRVF